MAPDSLEPLQPLVVAVANQKGGVGKTTTVLNLATALAQAGLSILIVDIDPQGNASTGIGIPRAQRSPGTYALFNGLAEISTLVRSTDVSGLSIIPAGSELAGVEIEIVQRARREYVLKDALQPFRSYDVIVVDCPPSLGLLTVNALIAATMVLVPLQCEFFALEGVSQLVQTITHVRAHLNPALRLSGIILTMHDRRNNLSELVAADARSFFGRLVYDAVIPRNVRVSEAPSHGKPVMIYDAKSPGAQAYTRVAQEFLQRAFTGEGLVVRART